MTKETDMNFIKIDKTGHRLRATLFFLLISNSNKSIKLKTQK